MNPCTNAAKMNVAQYSLKVIKERSNYFFILAYRSTFVHFVNYSSILYLLRFLV